MLSSPLRYANSTYTSLCKTISLNPSLKSTFNQFVTEMLPKDEKHAFVKVELADFWCVFSRKIFRRDRFLVHFSTLC